MFARRKIAVSHILLWLCLLVPIGWSFADSPISSPLSTTDASAGQGQDRDDDSEEPSDDEQEKDAQEKEEKDDDHDGKDAKEDGDDSKNKEAKEVKLKGKFVASDTTAISVRPEEWTSMKILSAVAHGEKVKKGDVLVQLETQKIDVSIQDLEYDVELGKVSLAQAEESLKLLRKSTPLTLAEAERSERHAAENLKRFLTIDEQASKDSMEFSLKSANNWLAYQEEELKQLQQMYEEDDLTEETEEIILKRTKDSVESARFSLERAERNYDRGMSLEIPRKHEDLETAVQKADIELERSRLTLPSKIAQEALKLQKSKLTQDKLTARLERMRNDRDLMTIKTPRGGIVYYGEWKSGKWSDATTVKATLQPGGSLKANQTFMTIVQLRPIHVEASISEKELRHATVGAAVTVIPTAYPDLEIPAEIEKISAIPVADGRFSITLSLDLPEAAEVVVPGMACSIQWDLPTSDREEDQVDTKG